MALLDRLEQALVRARAHGTLVAVLFCDLDHFKDVNDRFGHQHGDRLLQEVARRITAVVDPTDTVSRFGGDEFVVLCDDLRSEQDALEVADRVALAVEGTPIAVADDLVHITTSIGVAFSTPSADHPEALVRDADVAMYRAKASGRARREVFHESIRRAARDRDELAQELAAAIHDNQLALFYQPLVSLGSGGVEGLEALVRWPHPTRGLLGPGNFIPVAEETGLIVALGRWVADEAAPPARRVVGRRSPLGRAAHARQRVGPPARRARLRRRAARLDRALGHRPRSGHARAHRVDPHGRLPAQPRRHQVAPRVGRAASCSTTSARATPR